MSPEDVPAEWVEKATQAAYAMHYEEARVWHEAEYGLPLDEEDWPVWDPEDEHFSEMLREQRHALAAVLPETQAQALREIRDEFVSHDMGRFPQDDPGLQTAVNILTARAARLTATTEETP